MDLVVEVVAGSSGALTKRVTALDHEVVDDAVEDHPVVEFVFRHRTGAGVGPFDVSGGKTDEVLHGLRCMVAEQVDRDVTLGCVESSGLGMGSHTLILSQQSLAFRVHPVNRVCVCRRACKDVRILRPTTGGSLGPVTQARERIEAAPRRGV